MYDYDYGICPGCGKVIRVYSGVIEWEIEKEVDPTTKESGSYENFSYPITCEFCVETVDLSYRVSYTVLVENPLEMSDAETYIKSNYQQLFLEKRLQQFKLKFLGPLELLDVIKKELKGLITITRQGYKLPDTTLFQYFKDEGEFCIVSLKDDISGETDVKEKTLLIAEEINKRIQSKLKYGFFGEEFDDLPKDIIVVKPIFP